MVVRLVSDDSFDESGRIPYLVGVNVDLSRKVAGGKIVCFEFLRRYISTLC